MRGQIGPGESGNGLNTHDTSTARVRYRRPICVLKARAQRGVIVAPRPVLIADDNPDDLFFARRAVEKAVAGVTVVTCSDGRELVELLAAMAKENQPPPRTVFLDIKMPRMDGFEVLRWIRGQKHLDAVPVVMLSGSGEARDRALAHSLGANDYFVKYPPPADFARVLGAAGAEG